MRIFILIYPHTLKGRRRLLNVFLHRRIGPSLCHIAFVSTSRVSYIPICGEQCFLLSSHYRSEYWSSHPNLPR